MDRKGIEIPFSEVFGGLLLVGAAAFVYFLLYTRIQEVTVLLRVNEAEVHAINLGQVLMSSDIAYGKSLSCSGTPKTCDDFDSDRNGCESQLGCDWCGCGETIESLPPTCDPDSSQADCQERCWGAGGEPSVEHCTEWFGCRGVSKPCGGRADEAECGAPETTGCTFQAALGDYQVQRGVFDKSKLDAGQLQNLDIWYPDAIAVVEITDLETNQKWSAVLIPDKVGGTASAELFSCLESTFSIEPTMMFRITCFPIPNLGLCGWDWQKLYQCFTEGVEDQINPSVRDFSVAIRVSDTEIHSGKMTIGMAELFF